MASYDYDLFTIGAGSGGVRASRIAASYGAKVAVAEEYRVGGTCVIRGCVPKKLFVYASEFSESFHESAGFGWTVNPEGGKPSFDWATLIANKDKEIDRLNGIYIKNLEASGAHIIESRAVLKDANTVHLVDKGKDVTAKNILIAVGAWPNFGEDIPGLEHAISSNEAFHLQELPKSIVINGGGFIAVEFACIFHGLGVDVSLIYRRDQILRGFDDDLRDNLHLEMARRGIRVIVDNTITAIGKSGEAFDVELSGGETLSAEKVMYALGRKPKIEGLGLEKAGVGITKGGAIKVDEFSQTSVPNIYAVGDVTGRANLTPVAIREGAAVAETLFNDNPVAVDHSNIPSAVFSQPEIGTVGMTEAEAREAHTNIDIYRSLFRPMKGTLSGSDEKTMMKLVVDADTDKVLGVHILGHSAGEMIQAFGIAVKMGATKADFDATMAVHPTAAEELVTMKVPV